MVSFRKWFEWNYVGTVEGPCQLTGDDGLPVKSGGNKSSYWNLYERGSGARKAVEVGENSKYYRSQACTLAKAAVMAWEKGGPLPKLHTLSGTVAPPSQPKAKAKLIVFDGGKKS